MNTKHYTGIDFFRIIACIFVIAIHTAPLYQINEDIDLLFTRGLCRLAAPTSWKCSACGGENTGNFCEYCGTSRP